MKKALFVLTLLLMGCTKYIPTTTIQKEIQYKYVRDSIYTADTTRIYEKGDTVFNEKIKYVYIYKSIGDTIYLSRVDSIPYPVEVVKTKAVTPKWAWYTLVISIVFVIVLVLSLWKKIRNLRL